MTYENLIADHEAMERLARFLLDLSHESPPDVDAACSALQRLAARVRDHLAVEDPMLYATASATAGTRHAPAMSLSVEDFAALKECWSRYLYRWDRAHIEHDWAAFGEETEAMLAQLNARVQSEQAILYSLALHHGVIAVG